MKTRIAIGMILVMAAVSSQAQAQNIEGQIIAAQFGEFHVPSVGAGFSFPVETCQVSGGGKNFAAFRMGSAVKIVDNDPSQDEVVMPTAVFIDACSVSLATAYAHSSFYLTSGTGGLQEAILNGPAGDGSSNTIILNAEWYALVAPSNPAAVIASVQGNASLGLVDVTTTPYTTYSWNGSSYTANSSGGGAPTGAAGGALSGNYPNPGVNPAAVIVPNPGAGVSQTITQANGTALHLNNVSVVNGVQIDTATIAQVNHVRWVDGTEAAGIGQPSVAWSPGTLYAQCQAVAYAGGNYLEVMEAGDNVTTPGTNSRIWYPLPNAATPTQLDCAWYVAAGSISSGTGTTTNGSGASLWAGSGVYPSNLGLVEPTVTTPGWPAISLYGQGQSQTTFKLTSNNGDGFPFLYLPKTTVAYAFANFNWIGFSVDANYNANGAIGIYGAQQFTMKDMLVTDAGDGSDHEIEFGDAADTAHGWDFEPNIENVDLGTNQGFGTGAVIATTVTGGVPTFSVTAGGSGYTAADTQAILAGTSDYGRACASPGTTTATIAGGAITAVSSTATGCVAPLYTIIYGGPNINYGYKFSNTSDAKNLVSMTDGGVGWVAGLYVSDITNQMIFTKYHPESVVRGVQIFGGATFVQLQCDTVFQYCADVEGAGVTDFINPIFQWNNPNMTASRDYFFGLVAGTPGYSEPQAVNIYGEACGDAAQQPGYAHFDTGAGVVDTNVGSEVASLPVYVHDVDPLYCNLLGVNATTPSGPMLVGQHIGMSNGSVGNQWDFFLGTNPLNGGTQTMTLTQANSNNAAALGAYSWDFTNATPATSGNNYSSPIFGMLGAYWNGSASVPFGVNHQLMFGLGANPTATYSFVQDGPGPSGGLVYSFDNAVTAPALADSGLTAGNCVQAGSAGLLTSTGSACGSGSATPAFSAITGGANTAAAMVVGAGASLGFSGTGTIDASTLGGASFAAPGAIGSATAGTGAFTTVHAGGSVTAAAAGAASTPGVSITGAPYVGGTATTTFPQLYLNDGAAVTTLSTAGTEFGINAPAGFGGHFLNFFVNGGSTRFRVDSVGDLFVAGTGTFAGTVGLNSTAAPSISNGAGAGTSPGTATVTGNNNAGVITVITGTAAPAASTLATVTFNGTLGTTPNGCSLMPRSPAAASASATIYTTAPSATAFSIGVGSTALAASTTYSWSYLCL